MEKLQLPLNRVRNLYINRKYFEDIHKELDTFLDSEIDTNNISFVKKILFNQEIKSNNTIEGIYDSVSAIESVIRDENIRTNVAQRKRILNLYEGYKYILSNKDIDEQHLEELYKILSNGLLDKHDLANMGDKYRQAPVYILKNGRLDTELDQGLPFEYISQYMNYYFDYVNTSIDGSLTDHFIKSQIMHFYFVYIHPYFDVNGRTSRTMSMWYLLKNEAYPFMVFNRAITFGDSNYDKAIIDVKKYGDISYFIKYMMINVKRELEKELVMNEIKNNSGEHLESQDFQTLNELLSMKGDINVLSYVDMYLRHNDPRKVKDIYEKILRPLIDKNILLIVRTTNKCMFSGYANEVLKINPNLYNKDNVKIKRLNLSNK